ncbi:Ribokinase-like protein [Russula aff. rugulosa BPL654]|nr:Ribokinase-like protein [Russula aff. rugulosa BPL654]
MSRLRPSPTPTLSPSARSLRVVAAGTLFLTHTLSLPTHPGPTQTVRAHEYARSRGGSAPAVLSVLSQLHVDKCWLVASLGGAQEARAVARELEAEGVSTRYCKVWEGAGVPAAWVLHAGDSNNQSVINHNPLPDIPHEEFVSLLGPLLRTIRWIHFEGRSVKTTLNNIQGLDGLARERRWRSQCVFSVDVGRRARQGIEALIPHADVVFLNRHYAQAQSPAYASAPRAFLLALTRLAPPHALLVAYWGADGAAALSVPTREYFQSSGWTAPPAPVADTSSSSITPTTPSGLRHLRVHNGVVEAQSVRSGSGFWAAGHDSSHGSSAYSASQLRQLSADDSGDDSDGTEIAGDSSNGSRAAHGPSTTSAQARGQQSGHPGPPQTPQTQAQQPQPQQQNTQAQTQRAEDIGAQDAFIAGMIYALSKRLLPGAPYAPGQSGSGAAEASRSEGGRWKLDECLRFATELAGRKARRRTWDGLGEEIAHAGWFDS